MPFWNDHSLLDNQLHSQSSLMKLLCWISLTIYCYTHPIFFSELRDISWAHVWPRIGSLGTEWRLPETCAISVTAQNGWFMAWRFLPTDTLVTLHPAGGEAGQGSEALQLLSYSKACSPDKREYGRLSLSTWLNFFSVVFSTLKHRGKDFESYFTTPPHPHGNIKRTHSARNALQVSKWTR